MHKTLRIVRGVTLVEMLVVVSVLGILLALLLPAVQMAREASRRVRCANNENQIAIALHNHEAAFGYIPPTLTTFRGDSELLYWQARILGFLEEKALLDRVRQQVVQSVQIYSNESRKVNLPKFQCSSNPDMGLLVGSDIGFLFAYTDYCGVAGTNSDDGVFPLAFNSGSEKGIRFRDITNGLSNTLWFGERPPSDADEGFGAWIGGQNSFGASTYVLGDSSSFSHYPYFQRECQSISNLGFKQGKRGSRCDWTHHWSFHPGGANFSRADGSVFFLSYDTDIRTLSEMSLRR